MRRLCSSALTHKSAILLTPVAWKINDITNDVNTNVLSNTTNTNTAMREELERNETFPSEHIIIRMEERVKVSHEPIDKFVPDLAENPELLTGEVKAKPFFNPEHLQLFTASAVVGAATAFFLYFVITRNFKNASQEQQLEIELAKKQLQHSFDNTMEESSSISSSSSSSLLPEFAAPSSYAELRRSMLEQQRLKHEEEERLRRSTSFLHMELMYRLKRWWNQSLTNVQYAVAQEARRESKMPARITSTLQLNGFNVIELRHADVDDN